MGHHVDVITSARVSNDKIHGWKITDESGVQVHWYPVPYDNKMNFLGRVFAFFKFAWHASRRASSLKGDVVFATSTPLTIAIPGVYASRRLKVPMVFEVRDLWPEMPIALGVLKSPLSIFFAKQLERFAYKNSARVIALSPGMKEGVVSVGYPEDKVLVIPNSADLDEFGGRGLDPYSFRSKIDGLGTRPLIVYTGTLGVLNGVTYLVEVAKFSKEMSADLAFVVIGAGAEYERIKEKAIEYGVLGLNFWLFDALPKKEIPNVLAAADVACSLFIDLPAMRANSANKFFDALASGTPVAINYLGWHADLLNKTGAGLTLPPESPKSAAFKLVDLCKCVEKKNEMGRIARKLAEVEFSRDELALKLEAVLQEVTNA